MPKDTAVHHRAHVLEILQKALDEAKVTHDQIDVVCYTKGKDNIVEDVFNIYVQCYIYTFSI